MATGDDEQRPHFALFPFLAQGHLIPMADIGRLLAQHGAKVTILTTPFNADRIKPVISRSKPSIDIAHLELRRADVGLPEGVESMDKVRDFEEAGKFFQATYLFREQLRRLLVEELRPPPCCLVADMCYPWAGDLARDLGVPRVVFHGTNCFSLMSRHVSEIHNYFEEITSTTEYFVLPDFPHRIETTKAQLTGLIADPGPEWLAFRDEILRADREALGTVANSFRELEPEYVTGCERLTGKRIWCVGPVSLCNDDVADKAERGNRPAIDVHECSKWLDSKEPGSVLYACLGSLSTLAAAQLIEIGLALESSNRPFVWVVRDPPEELEKWISENGFEEKGLIIRGWAPQVLILSHPSVGGFLTHCGWNSTLEGISYGIPMLTWPVLGEQFCNERFIVDVIGIGVRGGVELPVTFGDAERIGVQVRSEEIKIGIDKLMDLKGGEERRVRAKKLARAAKRAVEEGGSSYAGVDRLIEDVMKQQRNVVNG